MFHKTIVLGNLGGDPELIEFESGRKVCNFSLAVNEAFTNADDEKVERTTWYRCAAWNGTGNAIFQYKKKGDPLLVEGRMRFDRDEESGMIYPKLVVQTAKFVNGGRNNHSVTEESLQPVVTLEEDLEMPF